MSSFSAKDSPYIALYGQPDELLHDGELYLRSQMGVDLSEGLDYVVAVALPKDDNDLFDSDDPLDVECSGPPLLVFNHAVYQKSSLDPAFAGDHVLRTITQGAVMEQNDVSHHIIAPAPVRKRQFSIQPQDYIDPPVPAARRPLPAPAPAIDPPALDQPPVRATHTSMNTAYLAGFLAAQSARSYGFSSLSTTTNGGSNHQGGQPTPPQTNRPMPPRAIVTNKETLAYGFDLPPALRSSMTFTVPLSHNYFMNGAGQQQLHTVYTRPARMPWEDDQKVYTWELVQLAMLQLNRPVERRDCIAITEALHRQFEGTTNESGELYPLRGFNTIHCMIIRHPGWAEFKRYLLP